MCSLEQACLTTSAVLCYILEMKNNIHFAYPFPAFCRIDYFYADLSGFSFRLSWILPSFWWTAITVQNSCKMLKTQKPKCSFSHTHTHYQDSISLSFFFFSFCFCRSCWWYLPVFYDIFSCIALQSPWYHKCSLPGSFEHFIYGVLNCKDLNAGTRNCIFCFLAALQTQVCIPGSHESGRHYRRVIQLQQEGWRVSFQPVSSHPQEV